MRSCVACSRTWTKKILENEAIKISPFSDNVTAGLCGIEGGARTLGLGTSGTLPSFPYDCPPRQAEGGGEKEKVSLHSSPTDRTGEMGLGHLASVLNNRRAPSSRNHGMFWDHRSARPPREAQEVRLCLGFSLCDRSFALTPGQAPARGRVWPRQPSPWKGLWRWAPRRWDWLGPAPEVSLRVRLLCPWAVGMGKPRRPSLPFSSFSSFWSQVTRLR